MTNTIYKFNSNGFSEIHHIDLFVSNAQSIIVSQTAEATKHYSNTIAFSISTANNHVPYLDQEDMVVVIREKVDLSAHGSKDVIIKNADKDKGRENYKDFKPYRPLDLPIGFIELKGEK